MADDISSILTTGGISTGFITCVVIIYKLLKNINNKRFHSSCCGKDVDIVVAVNELSEEEKKPHHTEPSEKITSSE